MRSSRSIYIVSCHAEGEVGDVIVGGVAPPPGDTLWEQSRFIAKDQSLRNFVLNEPRGGVFRHINLLVPPKHPKAAMGFIIMEPEDTPPMSGSNSICVATVLLDAQLCAANIEYASKRDSGRLAQANVVRVAPGTFERIRRAHSAHDAQYKEVHLSTDPTFALKFFEA